VGSPIRTDRLDLVPMTPAFLRASLDGDRLLAEQEIGAILPDDWPDIPEILELRLAQLEVDSSLQPWLLRAMILRESGVMVGHIGFHDAPGAAYLEAWSPGAVEFGFTVFPPHRRQGYAREASNGLMQWAVDEHGVTAFVLTIAPGNAASQTLAASLGFKRAGEHVDEVDGVEDILLREITKP